MDQKRKIVGTSSPAHNTCQSRARHHGDLGEGAPAEAGTGLYRALGTMVSFARIMLQFTAPPWRISGDAGAKPD
jgi:hypothetical protein